MAYGEEQEQGPVSRKTRIITTPDGRMIVVLPGETDEQATARAGRTPQPLIPTDPGVIPGAGGPFAGALSTGLKALNLGFGLIPGVRPAQAAGRALLTGGTGAVINALEGESPVLGAALNAVPEMGAARIASRAPGAGTSLALRTSGLSMTARERKEAEEAFARETARSHAEGSRPIRVGEQGVPETRAERVGASMRSKEEQSPWKPNVGDMAGSSARLQATTQSARFPETLDRALDAAEKRMLAEQVYKRGKDIYKHLEITLDDFMKLPDEELMQWAKSTDMPAVDFGDFVRAQKKEGRQVIRARQGGQMITPEDTLVQGQMPADISKHGQDLIKQNIPGVGQDLERLTDLYNIEDINNAIRETLGKASVRGGMGGAQGSILFGRPGGLGGGILGMLASPQRISGTGHRLGSAFAPHALAPQNLMRELDLSSDVVKKIMELYQQMQSQPEPTSPEGVQLRRR